MNEVIVAGFPITGRTQLSQTGEYRGIRYKISNHGRQIDEINGGRGTWCYYVYVNELQLSAEDFDEFWLKSRGLQKFGGDWREPSYDYWAPEWAEAEWHGGVTFYKKHGGHDEGSRIVEIGCDYAHLHDGSEHYEFDEIERDMKRTIDAMHKLYTFLEFDRASGKYIAPKTAADAIDDIRADLAELEGHGLGEAA
ncbi:hypothetical protein [Agrobacterium tumefaciens]|jgi:hypothetical protein|uniref:hypothetical protein n=1 Tax=Agrobacterium tumefaciens TaxID=358 RepID=UPI00046FFB78